MQAIPPPDTLPTSGDYYGVVYRGGPIVPILIGLLLVGVAWWILRRRRKAN